MKRQGRKLPPSAMKRMAPSGMRRQSVRYFPLETSDEPAALCFGVMVACPTVKPSDPSPEAPAATAPHFQSESSPARAARIRSGPMLSSPVPAKVTASGAAHSAKATAAPFAPARAAKTESAPTNLPAGPVLLRAGSSLGPSLSTQRDSAPEMTPVIASASSFQSALSLRQAARKRPKRGAGVLVAPRCHDRGRSRPR